MNEIECSLDRLGLDVDEEAMSYLISSPGVKRAQDEVSHYQKSCHQCRLNIARYINSQPLQCISDAVRAWGAEESALKIAEASMDAAVALNLYRYKEFDHERN